MRRTSPAFLPRTLVVLLILATGAVSVSAQPAPPGSLPTLDAELRAAIVDSVVTAIDEVYVIQEGADLIVAQLRRNLADGAYDEFTDPAEFAHRLETDCQETHHDGHFGIRALPPAQPRPEVAPGDPDRDRERRLRSLRARNFGFQKVEILPGNIGYLQLNQFAHAGPAAETAVAAMNYLANANALIIDLRQNGGGAPSMIRLLTTYLFAEREHLINWYVRRDGETEQSHTLDFVPGPRLTDVPVYVLTSGRTFSAAEEFTFDLKILERATVVGENTGGGGHTVTSAVFEFEGFRIGMRIPLGRAFDPRTGDGWEGKGVAPDIAVPVAEALETAHIHALRTLRDEEEDDTARFVLDWALVGLEAGRNPLELDRRAMKDYAGNFGPRRIFIDDDRLMYQREGRPEILLRPLITDLFALDGVDYFRLRFERDDDGHIVRVVGLYNDGNEDASPRTGG